MGPIITDTWSCHLSQYLIQCQLTEMSDHWLEAMEINRMIHYKKILHPTKNPHGIFFVSQDYKN